jgi:hypothetical protein
MTSNSDRAASALEARVAEKYRAEGFEVVLEPRERDLPFDLGTYRPDMIAIRDPNEGYIIEVKSSVSRTPIDRYREIAEAVAQHAGWSFLLITGDDVSLTERLEGPYGLLTWAQISERQAQADALLALGDTSGAFLLEWSTLEAALRRHALGLSIPIERLPSLSLINHLYSQGELSIEQFDHARALQDIRNRLVHGFQTPDLLEPTKQLRELVADLIAAWKE